MCQGTHAQTPTDYTIFTTHYTIFRRNKHVSSRGVAPHMNRTRSRVLTRFVSIQKVESNGSADEVFRRICELAPQTQATLLFGT